MLPFFTLHASDPPITVDFALRLLIGCLDATLAAKFSDWLEEVHPAVIVACCAGILQECVELGKEDVEVDWAVKIKSYALTVLDRVQEHSAAAGKKFEGIFCLVVWGSGAVCLSAYTSICACVLECVYVHAGVCVCVRVRVRARACMHVCMCLIFTSVICKCFVPY